MQTGGFPKKLGHLLAMTIVYHHRLALAIQFHRLHALLLPQHMRHCCLVEHGIVPACWARWVFVEATQISIDVIGAARTRNHRQIRWCCAKPFNRVFRVHRRHHGCAHLVGGEHHVGFDLLLSEAQVLQTVKAHGAGRVARQTVVGENLRATLQTGLVLQIDVCFRISAPACGERTRHRHHQNQSR